MDFQTCKQKVTFDSFNLSWLRIATEVPVHYVHCWLGTSAPDRSQHFCSDMHSGHMPGSNRKVLYLMQIAKYSNVIAVVQCRVNKKCHKIAFQNHQTPKALCALQILAFHGNML